MKKLLNLTVVAIVLAGLTGCSCVESLGLGRLCGRHEGGRPILSALQPGCSTCQSPCNTCGTCNTCNSGPTCSTCGSAPGCSTCGSSGMAMMGGTILGSNNGGCESCGRGGPIMGSASKMSGGEVISDGYLPAPTVTPGPGE